MRQRILSITLMILFLSCWCWLPDCHAAGKVIAAIMSSDQPRYREAHQAFIKSLAALGYTSANVEVILQVPNPDPLSWSNTIRKFNAYRPDLIVAYGAPAAFVAMKESDGIPVVSVDIFVSDGPHRGMCGVSSRVPLVTLIKTLKDSREHIKPYRRVGVIYNSRENGSQRQLEEIRKIAPQYDMVVAEANVGSSAALESALPALLDHSDVIFATESGIVSRQFAKIVARARARNIPVLSTMPGAAERGALISLEIHPEEQGHLAADIATRILEGARQSHLSLISPRRIELLINMRAAQDLGINLPFTVLSNATRVIK
ncbi:ABC transporter substrate-binding protein [Oryzomonas japonica]|uniref:ABC transporter substrate-binding protein n=1 Tax=Oryzomonas japonica TaxID=2603858 RepID=A0A7J4ZNY7_9BACT|nr:ABC transporter substrate-binding protein [Oryzomonas japonica]KAB0664464.1 ABC transporter substrate-binding protein [Oryzomonas japonica]